MSIPMKPRFLDANGQPMTRARRGASAMVDSHHTAASLTSQELGGFLPWLGSADGDWLRERDLATARIRHVVDNSGWASGAATRVVDQAIGANFRLSYRPDHQALGVDAEWAREFSRKILSRFRNWANDPRGLADAGQRYTLSGLIGLAFRSAFVAGECIAIPHVLPRGGTHSLALQLIDPDRLSQPVGQMETPTFRGGIEVDSYGAARAYHIRAAHPGDWLAGVDALRWERIPATTAWGRARVLHYFEPQREGQTRGKSRLAPILEALKTEDGYGRLEMQAALVNTIYSAFLESPFDHSLLAEALEADNGPETLKGYQDLRSDFHQTRDITLNGVRIPTLFPGEKFTFNSAVRPNQAYAAFTEAVLRRVAAGLGQSYEQLAQDWSKTNYSSARAALLESWKFLSARRDHFANTFCNNIFALWLEEELTDHADSYAIPDDAPGFWEAFAAWTRCRWIGPPRGWVDPVKEAEAAAMRMDYQLSTLEAEAADAGEYWEDVLEQQSWERQRRADFGLPDPTAAGIQEAYLDNDQADEQDREQQQSGGADARLSTYEHRMARLTARAGRRQLSRGTA